LEPPAGVVTLRWVIPLIRCGNGPDPRHDGSAWTFRRLSR